jgi:AcrR family transcriptional regulator
VRSSAKTGLITLLFLQGEVGDYLHGKKRKSTLIRKKQIIDATRKVIIRKGSEHLTLRAMAREVGFSEAAIYRHFKNKNEVLSYLMNTITDEMLHEIISGVAENPYSVNTIDAVLKHHLSGIEQRRGISFQIIAEIISLGDKKLNEKVYVKLTEYLGRIRTFLADGVRLNSIRNNIDLDAASFIFSENNFMVLKKENCAKKSLSRTDTHLN